LYLGAGVFAAVAVCDRPAGRIGSAAGNFESAVCDFGVIHEKEIGEVARLVCQRFVVFKGPLANQFGCGRGTWKNESG